MDPAKALEELEQISAQVQQVVIFDADGIVVASTLGDGGAASKMAHAAARLLEAAAESSEPVVQLEADLDDGSVALVTDGRRTIAATTAPEPTIGLVFYDLRTCLRSVADEPEKPKAEKKASTPRRKKAETTDGDATT
jgi:predicted regulator of Ras-like GTPase activity (Roadblock/LC7/MglB family)